MSARAKYVTEIVANLERYEESIKAARDLARGGYFDFAAMK